MIALLSILFLLLPIFFTVELIHAKPIKISAAKTAPLAIEKVLSRIELTRPLLHKPGMGGIEALAETLQTSTAGSPHWKTALLETCLPI